mmetsp:Transcript_13204/g.39920  ORF Transcript_13204/g.39920 Transcript_13204/m.39920 type:complete len:208 (+) Transcript_13204:81-704(+)
MRSERDEEQVLLRRRTSRQQQRGWLGVRGFYKWGGRRWCVVGGGGGVGRMLEVAQRLFEAVLLLLVVRFKVRGGPKRGGACSSCVLWDRVDGCRAGGDDSPGRAIREDGGGGCRSRRVVPGSRVVRRRETKEMSRGRRLTQFCVVAGKSVSKEEGRRGKRGVHREQSPLLEERKKRAPGHHHQPPCGDEFGRKKESRSFIGRRRRGG